MPITFGLTNLERELRAGSIGASETRIIVNGDDDALIQLWELKTGRIDAGEWAAMCEDSLIMQMGHATEHLHRHFFEKRSGFDVSRVQEHVTHPDYPGLHATLDGFLAGLHGYEPPNPSGDFDFAWRCGKPETAVPAVLEFKRRNARVANDDQQVANFLPQLHQSMALTGARYAVLSTLTTDDQIRPQVVAFDRFYWAECLTRVKSFSEAVATNTPPRKFPRIGEAEGSVTVQRTVFREFDLEKECRTGGSLKSKANLVAAYAATLAENSPSETEKERAKTYADALKDLKALLPKDASPITGYGLEGKRNKAGSLSLKPTEEAIAAAQTPTEAAA